ncbi:MAG TPA: hypothetical protein VGM89_07345, partial [Puia sp.]
MKKLTMLHGHWLGPIGLILILTVFANETLVAQTRPVTGKVTSVDSGSTLTGATIRVKGTKV